MKKLRNKQTGEVAEFIVHKRIGDSEDGNQVYAPFDLNPEKWEDVPEKPKTHWMIDTSVLEPVREIAGMPYEIDKEIGNWFDAKEEAEEAVEKLKAYKKLKDNGMIIYSFNREKGGIDLDFYTLTILAPRDKDSLDLLFGGEE